METDKEKLTFKELVAERLNHIEQVSEEINLCTELKTKVIGKKINAQYLFGEINYECSEKTVMADVYRFFNHFGLKLANWGLQSKINEYKNIIKNE